MTGFGLGYLPVSGAITHTENSKGEYVLEESSWVPGAWIRRGKMKTGRQLWETVVVVQLGGGGSGRNEEK